MRGHFLEVHGYQGFGLVPLTHEQSPGTIGLISPLDVDGWVGHSVCVAQECF